MKLLNLLIILIGLSCYSTPQQPDLLIYNGKTYPLHEYLLEDYFKKRPENRPQGDMRSTALWRGYVAVFKIEDKTIKLVELNVDKFDISTEIPYDTKSVNIVTEFDSKFKNEYTKHLNKLIILPIGEPSEYKKGAGIIFNSYSILNIVNSNIQEEFTFPFKTYEKLIGQKYYAFIKEEELLTVLNKLKERQK
ncbi:MAG: hypothetical protein H6584_01630 [Flavobacteriales bacterium]|nr:hypothetical protein [Flavobacteriales bacterium]